MFTASKPVVVSIAAVEEETEADFAAAERSTRLQRSLKEVRRRLGRGVNAELLERREGEWREESG